MARERSADNYPLPRPYPSRQKRMFSNLRSGQGSLEDPEKEESGSVFDGDWVLESRGLSGD